MKKWWWKILGIIIVLVTTYIGLMTPLAPGVYKVSSQDPKDSLFVNVNSGEKVALTITGYNTFFKTSETVNVWLVVDSNHVIKGTEVYPLSETTLQTNFQVPAKFPFEKESKPAKLIVSSKADGTMVKPDALYILSDTLNNTSNAQYVNSSILQGKTFESSRYQFPYRDILEETIKNTFFHVTLWFALMILALTGAILSSMFLVTKKLQYDKMAQAFTVMTTLFGVLGLVTGMMWATYTWGKPWSGDIKQTMTVVVLLIYFAYFVFRSALDSDEISKARFANVYNIFAFATLIPLLYIVPRILDSLHPGNGGNPALGGEDLDNTMRMIFYPAIIGWTLIGVWMADLYYRYLTIKDKINDIW